MTCPATPQVMLGVRNPKVHFKFVGGRELRLCLTHEFNFLLSLPSKKKETY